MVNKNATPVFAAEGGQAHLGRIFRRGERYITGTGPHGGVFLQDDRLPHHVHPGFILNLPIHRRGSIVQIRGGLGDTALTQYQSGRLPQAIALIGGAGGSGGLNNPLLSFAAGLAAFPRQQLD